ncbi:protein-glutamine gamma-glutamyltransferase 5-like [Salvelinus alpinus]
MRGIKTCSPCDTHTSSKQVHDNHTAHQTLGLSSRHLVVRRGRPFKVTMLLHGRVFNPQMETLIFTALLDDTVYIPFEDQRDEYVKNDIEFLHMGTPHNVISRPWSFGQYEQGILEICLNILQVSPQHSKDKQGDYLLRADPVYISRVVCAMVNCEDDRGLEGVLVRKL